MAKKITFQGSHFGTKIMAFRLFKIFRNLKEKRKKRRIYKKMLNYLQMPDNVRDGFCLVFYITTGISPVKMGIYLPEILKYKPDDDTIFLFDGWWFPTNKEGNKKRIEILLEILKNL